MPVPAQLLIRGGFRYAPILLSLLTFRLLPFAVFSVIGRRLPWHARAIFLILIAIVLGANFLTKATYLVECAFVLIAYLYIVMATIGLGVPIALFRDGALVRCGLLALSLLVFLVLPSRLGEPEFRLVIAVLGWDCMLKAYSYSVDRLGAKLPFELGDCEFFMLVDPSLCYGQRARRSESTPNVSGALARMLIGVAAMTLGGALRFAAVAASHTAHAARWSSLVEHVVRGVLVICWLYALHSGLASLQIGAMRLLGFELVERYQAPFRSRSPAEFWRRWNTYVGHWFRKYVFVPLAVRLARYRETMSASWATTLAVMLTFVGVGVAHDMQSLAEAGAIYGSGTTMFFSFGVLLLAWEATASALRRFMSRCPAWVRFCGSMASRVAFFAVLALAAERWA